MGKYVLNTMYLKPTWTKTDNNNGYSDFKQESKDVLMMVIKDDETNSSHIEYIEEPMIDYYIIKDLEGAKPYNQLYIDRNLVEKKTVRYSKRTEHLCKELGIFDEYNRLKKNINKYHYASDEGRKARNELKTFINDKINMNPYLYGIDIGIEEFYKTKYIKENNCNIPRRLNISYYDIETFIYQAKEKVDQNNPIRPINVITYCNDKYKHFYCLILRLPEYNDAFEYIKNNIEEFKKEHIDPDFKDTGMNVIFEFYEDERFLIQRFFELIHIDKPDFAMAWNNNYDNKYTLGRAIKLGMDINLLWCHPDVPLEYRKFTFIEDPQRKDKVFDGGVKKHVSRLWDWLIAPGYTCFIDQESLYSNLRKRYIEASYKLGDIAFKEIHETKVDLRDFGLTIRNAAVKNLPLFIKYSCRDTKLLYQMEDKNKDLMQFITLTDNTDLRNGVNISVIIKNTFYSKFIDDGKVIGNTIDYHVKEPIDGALVQRPELVDVLPLMIDGKRSKIFKNIVDFDAKSLYPSLMCQFKIGKENGYFRIIAITDEKDNFLMSGQEFAEGLQTLDTSVFDMCKTLYGLKDINEMLNDFVNENIA